METIQLPNAPAPVGHYSPAVEHNGLVFVSGQLPVNYQTGALESDEIEAQTEIALRNVERILHAAGSDLGSVLHMTIYISDIALWSKFNEVYVHILGEHKPARAVVPVNDLHFGAKVEIEAIAAVRQ